MSWSRRTWMPLANVMFRVWAQFYVEQEPLSSLNLKDKCLNTCLMDLSICPPVHWALSITAAVCLMITSLGRWMRFLQKSSGHLFKALQVWREQLGQATLYSTSNLKGSQYHFRNDTRLVNFAVLQNYYKEIPEGRDLKSKKCKLMLVPCVQVQLREEA